MALRPIYYDTETTGISAENDRIIEIALYSPTDDRSFVSLINPERAIPPAASAIHKITDDMVAKAPLFSQLIEQLCQFCEGESLLIAHNNDAFDLLFLQAEFRRAQIPFPKWQFLDSLKWARRYRPDLPRHSLQYLREVYGFAENQAHRALDDVIILSQIFQAMTDDLSIETICALLQQGNAPRSVSKMPFGKHQGKPLVELPPNYIQWMETSGLLVKPGNEALKKSIEQLGLLPPVKSST